MAYIIGAIIGLIALTITGLILRKRIYDTVDRLESWKMDIMNRNVGTELAKVKSLNLSGETQDRFESWKENWEEILSGKLPDIEEHLFDAEESADRYRITTARKSLDSAEETLRNVEREIEEMFRELESLLESEEKSRKEVQEMMPLFKGLRKNLIQNRYQFGRAAGYFEAELDELDSAFRSYHDLTESGNYFEAQGTVVNLKERLEDLKERLEEFPSLYKQCRQSLPGQIEELQAGIASMKEDGYRIEQLDFEKELTHYKEKLAGCVEAMEHGETKEPAELVTETEGRIKEMYQRLEEEAMARNYVEKYLPGYEASFVKVLKEFEETRAEVSHLQEAYYFEEQELDEYESLEKSLISLQESFNKMIENLQKKTITHTEIKGLIEQNTEDLHRLQAKEKEFRDQMRQLRKEELDAKEKLEAMNINLSQKKRLLKKSNIPGVPSYIWSLVDEVGKKIDNVVIHLEKSPLDMAEIQHATEEAEKSTNQLTEQVEFMLEQARLVELVIQYANRYRSKDSGLAAKLTEAENLFRQSKYEEALEQAASALQQVDPDALRRLEEYSHSEVPV